MGTKLGPDLQEAPWRENTLPRRQVAPIYWGRQVHTQRQDHTYKAAG